MNNRKKVLSKEEYVSIIKNFGKKLGFKKAERPLVKRDW
jgi:hypothetical protein